MWNIKPDISIVVPIFNEEASLRLLHQRLGDAMGALDLSYEILFIDDGSRDGSLAVLESLCDRDPCVRVIRLRRNFGQTAALTAGFDHAEADVIVTMDGDLQNDPTDIPVLLEKLNQGYDIVSGWRRDRKDSLLTKSLPSKLSNRLASWLTGVSLHDFGCTLKAYRREVVEEIHLYGELHRYIPAVAASIGVRVAEVEVKHHSRPHGKSKYGFTRLVRGLLDLVTVKLLSSYMSRPMQMFGGLGLLATAAAFLSGMTTLAMKLFLGTNVTGNPLLYLTMLMFLASLQFISLGFLGEIAVRTYHESQRKPIYVVQEVLGGSRAAAMRA